VICKVVAKIPAVLSAPPGFNIHCTVGWRLSVGFKSWRNSLLPNSNIKTSKGLEANTPWLRNLAETNVVVVL